MRPRRIGFLALALSIAALPSCRTTGMPSLDTSSRVLDWTAPKGTVAIEVLADRGIVRLQPGNALSARIEARVPEAESSTLEALQLAPSDLGLGKARIAAIDPSGEVPALYIDLIVPPWVEVSVRTRSADVLATDVAVPIDVETLSGRIDASFAGGRARLASMHGRVRVDGDFRRAEVRTASGDIEIRLPDLGSALARLEAESDHGDIALHGERSAFETLRFATRTGSLSPSVSGEWLEPDPPTRGAPRIFYATGASPDRSAQLRVRSRSGDLALRFDSERSVMRGVSRLSDFATSH